MSGAGDYGAEVTPDPDEAILDRLLRGDATETALPREWQGVARLLAAARGPATAEELAGEAVTVARAVTLVEPAPAPTAARRTVAARLRRAVTVKAVVVAALATGGVGVAAAVTGVLPAGIAGPFGIHHSSPPATPGHPSSHGGRAPLPLKGPPGPVHAAPVGGVSPVATPTTVTAPGTTTIAPTSVQIQMCRSLLETERQGPPTSGSALYEFMVQHGGSRRATVYCHLLISEAGPSTAPTTPGDTDTSPSTSPASAPPPATVPTTPAEAAPPTTTSDPLHSASLPPHNGVH